MAYDPLAYVDQTGSQVAQMGNRFSNNLLTFFQNNAEWQKQKANSANDLEQKKKLFDGTQKLLQQKGIDPTTFNIPNFSDKRVTPEDYATKLAEAISPAFVGKGSKLDEGAATQLGIQNNPMVKENVNMNKLLDKNDPMGQIDVSGVSAKSPGSPMTMDEVNRVYQQYPWLDRTDEMVQTATGMTPVDIKASGDTLNPDFMGPQRPKIVQGQDDDYDSLKKIVVEQARAGIIGSKDLADVMREMTKLKIAEKKELQKEDRTERRDLDKTFAAGVISSANTNQILDESGNPTDVGRQNMLTSRIGDPYPKPSTGGSGSGSTNRDKPTASWTQYNQLEAQLARLRTGKDESGQPLIFSDNPAENQIRIGEEYQAKANQASQHLLAHYMETSGMTYDDAQMRSQGVLDTDVILDQSKRDNPIIEGQNLRGTGTFSKLNLANPKTIQMLMVAARQGKTATDVLNSLRRIKGLHPSRQ